MMQGMLVLGMGTVEGIMARALVGLMFGLVAYYFAKRWELERVAGIGLVLCMFAGAVGGILGGVVMMAFMLIYAHSEREKVARAKRNLRFFKVANTDFGVDIAKSVYSVDRSGPNAIFSIEAYGDENKNASNQRWPEDTCPSIVIRGATTQSHDGMIEARFPANASTTAGITLQCAGTHAVEDLCVRFHSDGKAEIFGVIVLDGDRQPLRINWYPPAAQPVVPQATAE